MSKTQPAPAPIPTDKSRTQFALELVDNGKSVSEAARVAGLARNAVFLAIKRRREKTAPLAMFTLDADLAMTLAEHCARTGEQPAEAVTAAVRRYVTPFIL